MFVSGNCVIASLVWLLNMFSPPVNMLYRLAQWIVEAIALAYSSKGS